MWIELRLLQYQLRLYNSGGRLLPQYGRGWQLESPSQHNSIYTKPNLERRFPMPKYQVMLPSTITLALPMLIFE